MRWVTLGLNEVQQTRSIDRQPSATKYRYLDAVRALGPTAGQCISRPRIHRPLADGLFDSESSEEDPELWAGRLQVTTHRLSYDSLTQPNKPTPEETLEVTQALPHTRSVLGVTTYYSGQSKTRRWYIDGSKRHVRPGASNSNGDFRAAFRVHGPQQVYRAETTACAVASDLARGRDRAPQPGGGEGQSSSPQGRGSPWRITPYVPPRRAGGFGVFAAEDDQGPQVRFCGYVPTRHRQTNNGAELWAAVEALQGFWVPKLAILTDSQYLQLGATGRAQHWKSKGWTTTSGKLQVHVPVREMLLQEMATPGREVRWDNVPAHVNVQGNEVANGLAMEGMCSSPLWSQHVAPDSSSGSESTVGLRGGSGSESEDTKALWSSLGMVPMDSDELTGEASGEPAPREMGPYTSGSTESEEMRTGHTHQGVLLNELSAADTLSFTTDVSDTRRQRKKRRLRKRRNPG